MVVCSCPSSANVLAGGELTFEACLPVVAAKATAIGRFGFPRSLPGCGTVNAQQSTEDLFEARQRTHSEWT
jgi:hypothetical protein